jgi:conjugal transfer/entry exclusion protein
MKNQNLREQLINLDSELRKVKTLDEESKEILKKTIANIQDTLNRSGEQSKDDQSNLLEDLKKSAAHFEATHPELSESMHIVIHTLSNMGI